MIHRPGRGRAVTAVAMVLACAGALSACSSEPQLALRKAEPGLQKVVKERWYPTLTVGKVDCPSSMPRGIGKATECTVRVDGQEVAFRVVEKDTVGGVEPQRAEALLSVTKAEDLVRRRYSDIATVDCGERYIVKRPSQTFRCAVQSTTGRKAQVIYRVTDTNGNVRWVANT